MYEALMISSSPKKLFHQPQVENLQAQVEDNASRIRLKHKQTSEKPIS